MEEGWTRGDQGHSGDTHLAASQALGAPGSPVLRTGPLCRMLAADMAIPQPGVCVAGEPRGTREEPGAAAGAGA